MKFIPEAISRKVASQQLLASEHAPKALFVGGVVGMIGSTVLACRATLQLEGVLDEIEANKQKAHAAKEYVDSGEAKPETTYSDKELSRDLTIISIRGIGSIAKLYAPSIIVGAVSIAALSKSQSILNDRNTALTAAYVAVDRAYSRYRERVVDRFGEDVDREIYYETERVDIVDEETGKITPVDRITGAPGSRYARFYDEHSSRHWSIDPDVNVMVLRSVQNNMNDRLRIRGHVFLNEVYDALGMSHTADGAIVGWRWSNKYGEITGDDKIDFCIFDHPTDSAKLFFNGNEEAILLDFNVDGPIWNKINPGVG